MKKKKLKQSLNIYEENNEEINKQNLKLKEELKNKVKIISEKTTENKNLIKDN